MHESGRIIFQCPDTKVTYGGIRAIYAMVDLLCDAGFDAYVWHCSPKARMTWFANATPILASPNLTILENDVLVVPEMLGRRYAHIADQARVVILNQNHFHTFRGAGLDHDWPGRYPGWPNAVAVITTSDAIRGFVEVAINGELSVFQVPYWIDEDVFKPGVKSDRVVLLNRRRYVDLEAIVQMLHRSSPLQEWEVQVVGDLPQSDLAAILGHARIFVALSDREGFGLPPAEAMAAGCYVVGFTGDGGREFMLPEFSSPVDDPDIVGLVRAVEYASELWASSPMVMSERTSMARQFISSHYSRQALADALVPIFMDLTRDGSPAHQGATFFLPHYSSIKTYAAMKRVLRGVGHLAPEGLRNSGPLLRLKRRIM